MFETTTFLEIECCASDGDHLDYSAKLLAPFTCLAKWLGVQGIEGAICVEPCRAGEFRDHARTFRGQSLAVTRVKRYLRRRLTERPWSRMSRVTQQVGASLEMNLAAVSDMAGRTAC